MQLGAHMKLQLMHCRNPLLKDIPSHSSVMGVRCGVCARAFTSPHAGMPCMLSALCGRRGRKGRMAFAASFQKAYHFRLLFMSSQMSYPIMGALRHSFGEPWEVRSICVPVCTGAACSTAMSRLRGRVRSRGRWLNVSDGTPAGVQTGGSGPTRGGVPVGRRV